MSERAGGPLSRDRKLVALHPVAVGATLRCWRASVTTFFADSAPRRTSANADPGGNLILGQANTSGTANTSLSATTGAQPVFTVTNAGTTGPAVLLAPTEPTTGSPVGSLGTVDNGVVWHATQYSDGVFFDYLYSTYWSSMVVPINPVRALDTRSPAGRTNVLNPGVLDAQGRLRSNQIMVLNLTPYVEFGYAVQANAKSLGSLGEGFLTIWGAGDRPGVSSLNFPAGQTVSNLAQAVLAVTNDPAVTDVVQIYSNVTTHVLFDMVGFVVANPGQVKTTPTVISGGPALTPAAREALRRQIEKNRGVLKIR